MIGRPRVLVLSWAEPRLRPRLVNCSPNLGRAGRAPAVELRVAPSAPARSAGTGRVPRSGARFPQAGCGSPSPQSCALREPVISTPGLIRAALCGECAWHCTWVCVSPRGRRGAGPSPLPSPPHPPRCAPTLPAHAHPPGPGRSGECHLRFTLFRPCTLPAVAHVLCCCRLVQIMSKSLKKLVEESREKNQPEVDMSDRGISNMLDVNGLCEFSAGRAFKFSR